MGLVASLFLSRLSEVKLLLLLLLNRMMRCMLSSLEPISLPMFAAAANCLLVLFVEVVIISDYLMINVIFEFGAEENNLSHPFVTY